MKQPLVTIIVPTKNSAAMLRACLQSVAAQTYKPIELIVVDNHSTDRTAEIAAEFTSHVYSHGPERSAQRNFGAAKAKGEYVAIIDSDMELGPDVISDSVELVMSDSEISGVVIPEESFGEGFWAQCKRLERSFYVGLSWIEAARFFPAAVYQKSGGYDEQLVSGEDWDLSRRAARLGRIRRVGSFIRHNEGRLSLWRTLRKKYYYAQHAKEYLRRHPVQSKMLSQSGPLERYRLFLSRPKQLFRNPAVGAGMLFMKTAEFTFGAAGYLMGRNKKHGTSTA
jgi:glycosyltransferase involved in cell wall biosynthesis